MMRAAAELIPHRPPFLFVDELTGHDGATATARWRVPPDAWFLVDEGDGPRVPLAVLCESMCQAGALAATLLPGTEGLLPLLVGLEEVSAGRAVRPGETLELSAVPGRRSGPLVIAVLEARVDGSPVASGTARVAFAPSEEATER